MTGRELLALVQQIPEADLDKEVVLLLANIEGAFELEHNIGSVELIDNDVYDTSNGTSEYETLYLYGY